MFMERLCQQFGFTTFFVYYTVLGNHNLKQNRKTSMLECIFKCILFECVFK